MLEGEEGLDLLRESLRWVVQQNDEWLAGRRYLSLDSLAPLLEERRDEHANEEVSTLTAA